MLLERERYRKNVLESEEKYKVSVKTRLYLNILTALRKFYHT